MKSSALFAIISSCLLFACEIPITIDLNSSDPKIVIVGSIADVSGGHTVKITKTVNFDEANEFPTVSGALVTISDDAGNAETLTETSPGIYSTTSLQGVPGRTYTLEVTVEGRTHKAISTMPLPVEIDSVTVGRGQDIPIEASVTFRDPAGIDNYYRLTQIADGNITPNGIVDDDRLQDGGIITISAPVVTRSGSIMPRPGDQVTVMLQSIDKNVYEYMRMLFELEQEGVLGQTALSANPTSNINNGALGYFSAYSRSVKTIVVE
ncbi:DUF4249 family protein [Fulvivirgaceae bacterium PWU4]|uniref:DUF4249 family protein n=1 Tax=Chryseosolibacter histidini TaxID=2782349 RepID=A0AAP2DH13_9BACT|nr:DUF4249 domain-containing protein [Chryseosolibacter histidini]MBT1696090.1 DUF4249 family protein [Chryseosolibacter histidini]